MQICKNACVQSANSFRKWHFSNGHYEPVWRLRAWSIKEPPRTDVLWMINLLYGLFASVRWCAVVWYIESRPAHISSVSIASSSYHPQNEKIYSERGRRRDEMRAGWHWWNVTTTNINFIILIEMLVKNIFRGYIQMTWGYCDITSIYSVFNAWKTC